jgi:hypothetical protein
MTGQTGIAALAATLRDLADALDGLLAMTDIDSTGGKSAPVVASCARRLALVPYPNPDADDPGWSCRWCHHPIHPGRRANTEYCSDRCRKAAWRKRTGRS